MTYHLFRQVRVTVLSVALLAIGLSDGVSAEGLSRRGIVSIDINKITDVLSSNGDSTVIPKRCVLHLPAGLENKIARKPNQKYAKFSEFYRKNQTWIFKMEITMAEARGDTLINIEKLNRATKLGKVVLAVHNGHPIAVRTPMKPANDAQIVEIRK
ncbi:hypothetical protein BSZ32_05275 [Rubritalea profundi]|uniref:Uncharacterized protein n=2 Tax=Rubritalea profundi TaxID=1658618 RepID=A0A2S7TZ00_9BACT|nr:hypothetical protein BSZ32_05275 [Rubritalea profundi]